MLAVINNNIIIYFTISCHSRTQDIFMKQHHSSTQLQVWTIDVKSFTIYMENTVHKQYLCSLIPRHLKKKFMEDSIPFTWDFDLLTKNSKTNNTGQSHSKHLLLQIIYTNMSIITMFLQEMFPRCPEKATFSRLHHGATIHSFVMYVQW